MDLETLRKELLDKPGAAEDMPFGPEALVYKVAGKMFALVMWKAEPLSVNLKCDPDLAVQLRQAFPAVTAAYHMNKKHWNTVLLDGSVPEDEVRAMIEDSYRLVVKGLKKEDRAKLGKGRPRPR
jgi:predicted DNA-binding protein (MmcQ/YjbR family)